MTGIARISAEWITHHVSTCRELPPAHPAAQCWEHAVNAWDEPETCAICGDPQCAEGEHCEECLELLCFCICEDDEGGA